MRSLGGLLCLVGWRMLGTSWRPGVRLVTLLLVPGTSVGGWRGTEVEMVPRTVEGWLAEPAMLLVTVRGMILALKRDSLTRLGRPAKDSTG